MLKVLNHASRTLPRLPYTNLKKSRTEKNWLLSMRSRDSLQGNQCSAVNAENFCMASGCVPGSGGRRAGSGRRSSKSLFNQIHS